MIPALALKETTLYDQSPRPKDPNWGLWVPSLIPYGNHLKALELDSSHTVNSFLRRITPFLEVL